MRLNRRQLLGHGLLAGAAWASPALLAAAGPRGKGRQQAALIVPVTGASADLGRSVERAANLARSATGVALPVFDTAQAGGPGAAAGQALRTGARCLIGPIFGEDVRAVAGVARDRAIVLSLSNDGELRDSGAFLLGVTAAQATGTILGYAADRGVRNIAIAGSGDRWSDAVAAEAERLQAVLGISVRRLSPADVRAGQIGGGDWTPHAVLIAGGGDEAIGQVRSLRQQDVQLLGTHQLLDHRPDALRVLDGAWIAAPDPEAFQRFATGYADHGSHPGLIAALGHDAALIAGRLAEAGTFDAATLVGIARFDGATGPLRFRSDGSCIREMAVLAAGATGYRPVDRRAAG